MTQGLEAAMNKVEMSYVEIRDIADEMLNPFFEPVDKVINELSGNINKLTTQSIRDSILELALSSYKIGEIKDKSALKADIAEALKKEKYAESYSKVEGTVAAKESAALLESSPQVVSEILYNLISSLAKTKLDEIHRVVDSLKSILMSRMQELKMTNDNLENMR